MLVRLIYAVIALIIIGALVGFLPGLSAYYGIIMLIAILLAVAYVFLGIRAV